MSAGLTGSYSLPQGNFFADVFLKGPFKEMVQTDLCTFTLPYFIFQCWRLNLEIMWSPSKAFPWQQEAASFHIASPQVLKLHFSWGIFMS
jgi:hypothetical protein